MSSALEAEILNKYPNAVGVSIKNKRIRIYVTKKDPRIPIPSVIAGYPVEVIEVGRVKALAMLKPLYDTTERYRPAPGGVSIGHYRITAGTFGSAVVDMGHGKLVMLSNAHVFTYYGLEGNIGDPIVQPAPYDGGTVKKDKIGELIRWSKINFGGLPNLVDGAIAQPTDGIKREILGIGEVYGINREIYEGMVVRKMGRTTELTEGKIIDTNATIRIAYPEGKFAVFKNQILTEKMADGGDSGSLLVDASGNAVGLVFAGSEYITVHNKIENVMNVLNVGFGEPQKTPLRTYLMYGAVGFGVVGGVLGVASLRSHT